MNALSGEKGEINLNGCGEGKKWDKNSRTLNMEIS